MEGEALRILLIEDNPDDAELFRHLLLKGSGPPFTLLRAGTLAEASDRLATGRIDALLLDLNLPDSSGLDTVRHIRAVAPDKPIVVLTVEDESFGLGAIRAGAEDFLNKSHLTSEVLWHAICGAIERHRLQRSLYQMATVDDLTGLHNRRGFLSLASHQIRLANRSQKPFWLLLADLDDLKRLNDSYGHEEGNSALVVAAQALKETFRDSDVIGRIGGDEFAVLPLESSPDSLATLRSRLRDTLVFLNARNAGPYAVSLSVGQDRYDPIRPCSIEELFRRADALLYADKFSRKSIPTARIGRRKESMTRAARKGA